MLKCKSSSRRNALFVDNLRTLRPATLLRQPQVLRVHSDARELLHFSMTQKLDAEVDIMTCLNVLDIMVRMLTMTYRP